MMFIMFLCRRVTLSRTPWCGGWSGVTWCLWGGLCSLPPPHMVTSPPAQAPAQVTICPPAQDQDHCKPTLLSTANHSKLAWVWLQVLSFPLHLVSPSCWPAPVPPPTPLLAPAPPPTPCSRAPPSPWPPWAPAPTCPTCTGGGKSNKTLSEDGALTDTGGAPTTFIQLLQISSFFAEIS